MTTSFDFEEEGQTLFGKILRPVAKVTFKSPKNNEIVTVWMIVDTGADYTILPRQWAMKLGINFTADCWKLDTAGIGGEKATYILKKKIEVELGEIKQKVPVAFFDDDEAPALLGRLGFLELFETSFVKNKKVVFKI
ncbi:MAG: retropepsin-like aspartic protease [Patescibacteria group bacterium]